MPLKEDLIPTRSGLSKGSEGVNVERLQKYLEQFGYFRSERIETSGTGIRTAIAEPAPEEIGSFDDHTEQALRTFQRFVGIPETGELDQETLEKMKQDRCGNMDAVPKLEGNQMPSGYVLSGCKWNTNNLRYAFENFGSDLTQSEVRSAFATAFGYWAAVTPLTFTEVAESASPEILIRFGTGDHDGCPFPFEGELAHNFYPPTCGGGLAGDSHYNEQYTWSIDSPPSNYDLITVATHEIGHGLGLAHSADTDALMYPYYSGEHRFLHQDDIDGIQEIYGAAQWHHNKKIQRLFTSHHSENCWANVEGIGWRKVKTGSADGTTNMFLSLSAARSIDQSVNIYIEDNTIQIMYL